MQNRIRIILLAVYLMILLAGTFVTGQEKRSRDLFLVRVNKKAGYIDRTGKVVIKPKYEDAQDFSDGLAPVKNNGKWGFINEAGKTVIEPRFDGLGWSDLSTGLAPASLLGKMGAIDRTGTFRIEPEYETVLQPSDGLVAVQLPKEKESDYFEKWIYLDYEGHKAIDKEFRGAESFVDGRAFVKVGFDEWALIDKRGNEVTGQHFGGFEHFGMFSDGLVAVKIKDKYGFIDRTGKVVIKPVYEAAYNFSEGLASVRIGCKRGFINVKGELVIPANYDFAWKFSDGLAPASLADPKPAGRLRLKTKDGWTETCDFGSNGPKGYIDKTGTMVIPPQFGFAYLFRDGIAEVSFGEAPDFIGYIGKRGYIDKSGKYIWRPTQ